MAYCNKCGQYILNDLYGCPNCGKDNTGVSADLAKQSTPLQPEKVLSNALKVTIVSSTLLFSIFGLIFGVVMSIIFMNSVEKDYKSFGKALLVLCIVVIVISIICCVAWFLIMGVAGETAYGVESMIEGLEI